MLAEQQSWKQQQKLQLGAIMNDANIQHAVIWFRFRADRQPSTIADHIIDRGQPGRRIVMSNSVTFYSKVGWAEGEQGMKYANDIGQSSKA